MTPRKIQLSGDTAEDIRRLRTSVNYGEEVLSTCLAVNGLAIVTGAGATTAGSWSVDRSVFRKLLATDDQWFVYAAGLASSGDANPLTLSLAYVDDTGVATQLGSGTVTNAGTVKFAIGPFPVFATAGVPAGEQIPTIRLRGTKAAGANGSITHATLWVRIVSSRR